MQERGLSQAEATRRLTGAGGRSAPAGRSYASIVRANALTVFNLILAAFGALTLLFGDARDALFLGIIVANTAIGVSQEVRAKRALDRLTALAAPRATVLRDGVARAVAREQVVLDDVLLLSPGDQVVADGILIEARELALDESILTGESAPARRATGEQVLSGAFVLEGSGVVRATAVGEHCFAARVTGEARSFRHRRSPLERAVNRLLYALLVLVVALGALLGYSLYHRHLPLHSAVATATAGVVTLVPEGLMVLVSLTYAAGALRLARRGVLAQQLNAIESLAAVDTLCVDKTGTLTAPTLRLVETVAAPGVAPERLRQSLGVVAASMSTRNATLEAIASALPVAREPVLNEVPFSSARRFSALETPTGALYLGAPGVIGVGALAGVVRERELEGRRVLALAAAPAPAAPGSAEPDTATPGSADEPGSRADPTADLEPLGVAVLAEELRPNIREAIAFLRREGVDIKVLSGDAPETVAAIARDVGIPVRAVHDGRELPEDPAALLALAPEASVVGRISPAGKRALVDALERNGRYVAMIGDGVNDVPALKRARLAIAQGSGTQMARAVSDLVLTADDFAAVPALLAEGRRMLRNLLRVTRLYVTKSALAAFLILTIGTSSEAYPLLPRHLSLAATLTVGVPTFFLALAPSSGPWRPDHFVRDVARFATPAGVVLGTCLISGYLFAHHGLDLPLREARTVGLTTLTLGGLYLVMALEAGGSRRRSTLVAGMCAAMAGVYALTLALPVTRTFFALATPAPAMLATGILAGATSVAALWLCGFTLRLEGSPTPAVDLLSPAEDTLAPVDAARLPADCSPAPAENPCREVSAPRT